MTAMTTSADWSGYLERFHAAHPGITEDVLGRCVDAGRSPYEWLTEHVNPGAAILDLACGSGPARPIDAERWIGIDRSAAELARAGDGGISSLVRGDATALAIADASIETATCSMALMLIDPLDVALSELRRVLVPGGRLAVLLPARGPLSWSDRFAYLRIFWAARSTTKFPPTPLRRRAAAVLAAHGFEVESDETCRFSYPMDRADDADRLVDSWYLPGVSAARQAAARRRARALGCLEIGIPLRRVIARRIH